MSHVLTNVSAITLFDKDTIIFNIYEDVNNSAKIYVEIIATIQDILFTNIFYYSNIPSYIKSIIKYSIRTSSITSNLNGSYTLYGSDIMNSIDDKKPVIMYLCNPIGTIGISLDIDSVDRMREEEKNLYKSIYIAVKSLTSLNL